MTLPGSTFFLVECGFHLIQSLFKACDLIEWSIWIFKGRIENRPVCAVGNGESRRITNRGNEIDKMAGLGEVIPLLNPLAVQ